ncbi:glycosyltransferase [Candidatus Mycobacterium wuenschmannii]|uniref:Glycosyltransferase n=1 Tax=Candidatus Mycobacterium wuenschmannii TaxID=3027808 RepID=A0ABY8W0I9_9MYCO|nr:glycosyltransferase [Candidatus Mycobacterium wuenschmannii]WIM89071.1 glycosyltransferase [Candidatus Mycobacterium wuenschmannii]
MRYVLAAYGSRGDVEPCSVVGRELQRRGHDVRIAAPPNLLAFVESAGLEAVAYGPDSHAQLDDAAGFFGGHAGNPYGALPEVVRRVSQVWLDKGTVLASLTDGADLLVAGMNEQRLAANIAEYQGIPLIALHFFPSRVQPTGVVHAQLSKRCEEPLRRSLGMAEASEPPPPLFEIQAYDERCLPGQPDQWAEPGRPFAGALTLQAPADDDAAVLSWIREGTAPIYFGLGSTPISPPADIVARMIAACARLGERLLVCSGPNDLSAYDHVDGVRFVSAVNHAAVFPACRAVVHHGGAGTTAAAMRAGVPSLILWLWLDQPVWGAGVEQLNIGAAMSFSDATEESLMANLAAILEPRCRDRARNIAAQMMTPAESATCAADLIESAAQRG